MCERVCAWKIQFSMFSVFQLWTALCDRRWTLQCVPLLYPRFSGRSDDFSRFLLCCKHMNMCMVWYRMLAMVYILALFLILVSALAYYNPHQFRRPNKSTEMKRKQSIFRKKITLLQTPSLKTENKIQLTKKNMKKMTSTVEIFILNWWIISSKRILFIFLIFHDTVFSYKLIVLHFIAKKSNKTHTIDCVVFFSRK